MKKKIKFLLYGVDGLSSWMMDKHFEELPNFNKLKRKSSYGTLKSILSGQAVPHTGPCWTTIYTGQTPKTHGITSGGWLTKHINFHDIPATVFDILNRKGYKTGLFTMPVTYPARPFSGWMISGFPTASEINKIVYPKNLQKILPEDYTENYSSRKLLDLEEDKRIEYDIKRWLTLEDRKFELFCKLIQRRGRSNVDFLAYGTVLCDRTAHANGEPDIKAYKKADEILGKLLDVLEPDHILICSDHGFAKRKIIDKLLALVVTRRGIHDLNGFYMLSGPKIREDFKYEASIVNLAPTILNIFDVKIPGTIEGNVIWKVFKEAESTEEEEQQIKKQLKTLGYI